jgi:hypothetical protein
MLVRDVARKISQRKQPCVLLKLDIRWAFDLISWSFIFEVLRHLRFGDLFLKWVSSLLYTTNIVVIVNGEPGARIQHACGLWQGDRRPHAICNWNGGPNQRNLCYCPSWSLATVDMYLPPLALGLWRWRLSFLQDCESRACCSQGDFTSTGRCVRFAR